MKKRITCLLLTLVMLLSLIPAAAIPAKAAGLTVSEAGIRLIKNYVGYHKNAYETYSGSGVYKIGYGTSSVKGATISEANADKLLREEIKKFEDNVLNVQITVSLVQKRIDALAWYAWAENSLAPTLPSEVVAAVNTNVTGSDFVDIMCTWDRTGFTNTDGERGVVYRRLKMANQYLNGGYDASNVGNLSFAVLDAGKDHTLDGTNRMAVQAYVKTPAAEIKVLPTTGVFLGWYLDGKMMTSLNSATAGKTLTAKWQTGSDAVKAEYSIPAEVIYIASGNKDTVQIYIYEQPDESSNKINVLNRQVAITVVAEQMVGTDKWLKLSSGGWVKLGKLADVPATIPTQVVTITDDYVNIRKEPDATSDKLGTVKRGEKRTITMISNDGKWGYCSQGWIFLAYTDYDGNSSASSSGSSGSGTTTGTPGTVTGAARVNVRKAAGVGNALVTTLAEGTAITVYEQTTADGAPWGRIDQGWISMGYVKLQQVQKPTDGSTISTGSSAVVSSSVRLNVRSGPGTNYSKITTLAPGTSVVILRKETVNGATWGLIDQGWINLSYVTTTGTSAGGESVYSVGGTVVNCSTGVNIRAAAGTTNALIGVAGVGTRVNVTEITTVNGFKWGRIERGWVCMDYIQLDSEFKKPEPITPSVEDDKDNVVTSFEGYPAVTLAATSLLETAAHHANVLLTLNPNVTVNILAWTQSGENLYGKVTVGDKTGWVDISGVIMSAFNAKVTASKADVYEEPSTRSKFYASLVNGTYVTIPQGNDNWKLSDSTLWGKVTVTVSGVTYTGWLKLNDVTMFRGNTMPTGVTTLSGVGYLTGTMLSEQTLLKDFNGSPIWLDEYGYDHSEFTAYTLPANSRVNIQARSYVKAVDKTYGKVTVGSVSGWIDMANVNLDSVAYKANAEVKGFAAATDAANISASYTPVAKGSKITITQRQLVPDSNEINHGVIDVGYGFVGDDTSTSNHFWFILDDGKLTPTGKATVENPSNPVIASSVVVTGKAAAELPIYEEAIDSSNILLKLSAGTNVTIVNWRNVTNGSGVTETWGKVQINKVVGWVKAADVDFSNLTGVVAVEELKVYNTMDKASSVQVLRVNNKTIGISDIQLVGTTMWGRIDVAGVNGYIDLSNVKLNTPGIAEGTDPTTLPVMAKGKINSVNATVNINGEVKSLPKGTEVSLIDLDMTDAGEAWWLVELGDKDGWINMDCLTMYSAVATITESKAPIYNDLTLVEADILYTLYRDEKATVQSFYVQGGRLYGEVAYGNTTGWILLCDEADKMYVSLVPGSTGSIIGGGNGGGSTTEPTTPTTPAADPIPAYIVCSTSVNVRSAAGVGNTLVTTLPNGTNVKIYEKTNVLGKDWAHIDEGWVCMDYVRLGTQATVPNGGTNGGTGNVTIITTVPAGAIAVGYANQDINIRSGSGLGYPEVGSVKKGNSVVIYENKLDGGMSWGRTDNGWVCTSYLTITGIGVSGSGNMGTIARCGFTANVRNSASSNGALMAKVMISSRVAVHETTTVGTETWGRTDLGWISMQYIVLDSAAAPITPDAGASGETTPTETTPSETVDDSVG
ncbi:MAG: SH3 domain-containing protein [Firmicutes bacterium]|nr:SH3 domain-containing protein [Bacillota bacterium]MDY6160821.1 SH3 domain-containing protein [Candidatus Faecousia sp.]